MRPTKCLVWPGNRSPEGYGRIGPFYVHRILWEGVKGPIPRGYYIDHLCRTRGCVQIAHLEAVTPAENIRRGLLGRLKTHCKYGHTYAGSNVIRQKTGTRLCLECRTRRNIVANRKRIRTHLWSVRQHKYILKAGY